ncbi:hypothetical protein JOL62DRAFT_624340, partial [Phyllosticta paracitricarpa]
KASDEADKAVDDGAAKNPDYDSESDDNPRRIHRQVPQGLSQREQEDLCLSSDTFAWKVTLFALPSELCTSNPLDIFDGRSCDSAERSTKRFVLRRRHVPALGSLGFMAIFIDGACESSNFRKVETIYCRAIGDMTNPGGLAKVYVRSEVGGCCFIFEPVVWNRNFALEREGIDGERYKRIETRAQLRAALATLHYRAWYVEGREKVVLITSPKCVVEHAATSLQTWWDRGWVNRDNFRI